VQSFDAEAAASPPETTPEKPKAACGAMLVAVMQENAWKKHQIEAVNTNLICVIIGIKST